jgi:dTDP-4-amino-4,6-dideoxygalactose transaminase
MEVPLLDLKAQYRKIKYEIEPVVLKIIEEQRFIMGKELVDFEKATGEYTGAKYAIGISSGTDALLVSLMALDIKPGDRIATTPFSFFATAGSIARLNAVPVFVDIERDSFNMDMGKLKAHLKEGNIKSVIPVHLYGQVCDMNGLMALKKEAGFSVVEDAAQSIGAQYSDGKQGGTFGEYGCFSFFPSKNLGCFGDGGLVTTNDEKLAEKLITLRNHGGKIKYYHDYIGGNFRLDNLQAAVLHIKLKYLNEWHAMRRKNAEYYGKLIKEKNLEEFVTPPKAVHKQSGVGNYHIYNQFVIRAKDRDALKNFLIENKIGCEIYYPVPFHMQKCFQYLGYKEGDFPESEKACREVLALPVYPELANDQIEFVVETIAKFYKK